MLAPMKAYTVSIDIDLPRERVLELFDDRDNLFMWQTGLESFEHVSGEPGEEGAVSKLVYVNKGQRIELMETVTKRDLPDEFNGRYDWGGGSNTLVNRFIELGPEKTRWESTCEYQMETLMLKIMALAAPGMFKKQNMKFLENFKAFCEEGKDVRAVV